MNEQQKTDFENAVFKLSNYNSWASDDYDNLPYSKLLKTLTDKMNLAQEHFGATTPMLIEMSPDTQWQLSFHPWFYISPPGEHALPDRIFAAEIFTSDNIALGSFILHTNHGEFIIIED